MSAAPTLDQLYGFAKQHGYLSMLQKGVESGQPNIRTSTVVSILTLAGHSAPLATSDLQALADQLCELGRARAWG